MTFRSLFLLALLTQITGAYPADSVEYTPVSPTKHDASGLGDTDDIEEDVSIFMQHATVVEGRHPIARWTAWVGSPVFRALLAALLLVPALIAYAGDHAFHGLRGFALPSFGASNSVNTGRALGEAASPIDDKVLDALLREQATPGPIGLQTAVELLPRPSAQAGAVASVSTTTSVSDHVLNALLAGADDEAAMVASFRLQKGVDVGARTASASPSAATRVTTVPALSGKALDALVADANEEAEMIAAFRLQKKVDVGATTTSASPSAETRVTTVPALSGRALDALAADASKEAAMTNSYGVQTEVSFPAAARGSSTAVVGKALDALVVGADEEAEMAASFGVQQEVQTSMAF